ncbi:AEC family transporter [Bacillus sp. PS06]|uniref:AEC family transporter n=1 Tax=Bacillus sp. PS06 TaxID=2764176 RepID=UPI00177BC097|nr:AEC family transporter [Bacillus sp. PS06]MBD8067643.1 AEC family transporter [Bacillus sp. PS06]
MFQSVISILLQAIIPLSIPVIVGAVLTRYKNLDTKPLQTLLLYYLIPGLIFDTLYKVDIVMDDVYKTVAFSILNLLLLWGVAVLLSKALRLSPAEGAGMTLISTFTNSVNYGLPLILLTLGQVGLEKASVYVILQMIIVNTIGIYFAARSEFTIKGAIKKVFSLPAIYAAMTALILKGFHIQLPSGLESGMSMIAGAYAPVVLAILGAQMMKVKTDRLESKVQLAFWTGLTIRLIIAPIMAWICLSILQIQGSLFTVLFILACMPVAVNAVVLAEEFNASPKLVSKTILWSTIASFIVLPILISIVK